MSPTEVQPLLNEGTPVEANAVESGAAFGRSRQRVLRVLNSVRQQDWLALMLFGLHVALVFGIGVPVSRAFLLFHFGCFLLWQPVWRTEQKLYVGQVILIIAAATVLVVAESWWLMALWLSVLFAVIGGEVPTIKNFGQRIASLIAAAYLIAILLIWVVPHLFEGAEFGGLLMSAVRYGLIAPLVIIFLVKTERTRTSSSYSVDLIYSLLLFLMVVVLVLGAFVIRQVSHGDYVVALAQALLVIGGILVALSWLWDPRAGFAGIGHLLTHYFLSVGMPFERWMHGLANLADRERDPDRFLALAADEMAALPWVEGIEWQTAQTRAIVGKASRYGTQCGFGEVNFTLYTRWSASPALVLHIRLLGRLLADYYEAKRREQEQRQNAYMHAIYETGSRLTHDVKNLLQSLGSLCAAVESDAAGDSPQVRRLVQRQLPQIRQRLQSTLDKLNSGERGPPQASNALAWWREVEQRYGHEDVEFDNKGVPDSAEIPVDLFDRVIDNLLQNALNKRRSFPALRILATLGWDTGCSIIVCDSGNAISEQLARQLFSAPVASMNGFGVGLYQSARQASTNGYALTVASNITGRVSFALRQNA
ncbi:MAG: sensor histidine kinase [Betaproteobacteria bacterium]